ncbi:hypothetical protein IJG14_08065 [bacterium]|nr:hypothetical protein [bacterium]
MASIIDTVRTVMGSKNALIKLIFVSALLSYPFYKIVVQFDGWLSLWAFINYFVWIFSFGYIIVTSNNLINEKNILLPNFLNPFKIFFAGVGSILVLAPISAGMFYGGVFLNELLTKYQIPKAASITTLILVEIFLFGVFVVQMTLYSTKLNPLHAYNIVKILKTFISFSLKTIPLLLVIALFTGFVLYPCGYLAYKMFGLESYLFILIVTCFIYFLLVIVFQYYSLMAMENLVLVRRVEYEDDAGSIMDKELLIDKDKS